MQDTQGLQHNPMELKLLNPTQHLESYECPICLENGTTTVKLPCCKRQICRQCVCAWIAQKGMVTDCPFCRHEQCIYTSVNCSDLIDYVITMKSVYPDSTIPPQAIDNINQVLNQKYNIDNIVIQIDYKDCPTEAGGVGSGSENNVTESGMCTRLVKSAKSHCFISVGVVLLLYTLIVVIKSA
ncbi:MAG: hypothetical protein EBU90_04405 [Proteobacteria bacterium]|nr:hypothetical protein [Pseudomonadota bacterium]NBP15076.1 hypothetical protein [bacterium]